MNSLIRVAVFAAACQLGVLATGAALAQHNEYPIDPAFADHYVEVGDGRSLVLQNDYEGARVIIAPLAEAGNPVAQNLLGIILEHGSGDGASLLPAMDAYALAMAQGYGKAFSNAAMVYQDGGVDVPIDLALMLQTYRDGANVGYAPAHEEWVWHLLSGSDDVLDFDEGFIQAQAGVAQHPDSGRLHSLLADAYYYGLGTEENQTAALENYEVAAQLGSSDGQFSAGFQYYYGQGTEVDDVAARGYFEQAADQGHVWAYGYLASIYYNGYGVPPDYDRALFYARLGEGRDDGKAGYFVGEAYREGLGVAQDFDAARTILTQSSEDGYSYALTSLGDMAYFAQGEPEDYTKAFTLYEQALAADPNDHYASYSVGYMLMRGEGTDADYGRAAQLLDGASAAGRVDATFESILLLGSDTYAGPQSDPVRAQGLCLFATDASYFEDAEPDEDVVVTCTEVATQLTDAQQADARAIADAF